MGMCVCVCCVCVCVCVCVCEYVKWHIPSSTHSHFRCLSSKKWYQVANNKFIGKKYGFFLLYKSDATDEENKLDNVSATTMNQTQDYKHEVMM